MLKKSLALLLCALLALGLLAGCGGGSDAAASAGEGAASEAAPESGEAAAEGDVHLTILGAAMRLDSMIEGWEKMIEIFEEQNPGVTVSLNLAGEWDEIPQHLAQARMAGDSVDFVRTTGGIIRSTLAPSGAVVDLTDAIGPIEDRFVSGSLDAYKVGGRLWGVPYGETTTSCVFYNKTMFDELGLEEPTTYDELVACADTIRAEKGLRNPWIHQGGVVGYWPMYLGETYSQVTGNKAIEKTEAWLSGEESFENEETVAALAAIRELFEREVLTTDSLDTDETGMKALFAQQQAAMIYGGTWEYAPTLEIVDDAFEIGVFEFPSIDGSMTTNPSGAPDDGIAIASNCQKEHWDIIMKFLDHMTAPETVQLTIGPIQPLIPALEGVEAVDLPVAEELKSFMPETIMFLDWMWPPEVTNVAGNQIAGVAAGEITPEDAAKAIQESYEAVVRENDYTYNWYDSWTDDQWAEVTPPSAA